jgi:predicted transcriptional regulator
VSDATLLKKGGETMTTVKEIMTDKLLTISKDATLQQAAKLMKTKKVGCLLVSGLGSR